MSISKAHLEPSQTPAQRVNGTSSNGYGAVGDANEQQPRQEEPEQDEAASEAEELVSRPATPLPKMQIAILFIMRMSEPIAFLGILPFVPRMLRENLGNIPEEKVGYYVGFIESIFALTQFSTVYFWGSTSDRIGRKPVLLTGLLGTFISTNCYGFSKTFTQMIISRSIAGLMNANIGVLKSSLGEITDETNQARAFSLIPLAFSLGSIIGPSIGGAASNPAEEFPDIFGKSAFLTKYPYWLPCFICSMFNLLGFIVGFFFLKETLPSKVRRQEAKKAAIQRSDSPERRPLLPTRSMTEEENATKPTLRQLLNADVVAALINSGLMNFINITYIAVLPLFLYTTVATGGMSFTKKQIGYYLAANGLIIIIVQLFIFPPLEKRMGGPLATLRMACTALPLTFLCFPVAHFAAKYYGFGPSLAALLLLLLFRGCSSIMVVSSNLCINNVAPSRAALGKLNGLQQMLGCLSRGVGPIFSTSLFAFSISHTFEFIDGQSVWLFYAAISLITWYSSSKMKNANKIQWRRD